MESYTKLPVFNQEQLQRFERRFEAESEPDDEYQRWMDIYHPENTRKFPVNSNGVTSHMQVTSSIPAPANALQKQLTEAAAALTSLSKAKPKAAAHGRVLTSVENLKIIEEQQKEKDLKKGHQRQEKKKSSNKKTTVSIACSTKSKTASLSGSK